MSFIENIKEELNTSTTENGATGYATTGKALVDFNFKVASYRNKSEAEIIADFKAVWYEDKELALKYLFYVRDIRGGVGERRLFRICIQTIISELDERVFDWIGEYGRYDDLFIFFDTPLESQMILYVRNKITEDVLNAKDNKPISLLAKWMPSINTSSEETRTLAKKFVKAFEISEKEYRKVLSSLRTYINVLEKKLCSNKWNEVDYNTVPSQANLKYNKAFYKHDKERRTQYLNDIKEGKAKINSNTTFPHDIVYKYTSGNNLYNYSPIYKVDETLEAMWKALPDYVQGNSNIMVVRDGSGSMQGTIGNTSITALDVATSLAIYFAERCSGEFKDQFITFSAEPKFISLTKYETLLDKLIRCIRETDCSNTDIEATLDLILQVAIKNNLKQEEIPNLLIISDMEFDQACNDDWSFYANNKKYQIALFKRIEEKFNANGYKLPKLIFWNVNSRTNTIPLTQNERGVILVSGFSPAVTKIVLSEELDPYKALVNELNSERYKQITLK